MPIWMSGRYPKVGFVRLALLGACYFLDCAPHGTASNRITRLAQHAYYLMHTCSPCCLRETTEISAEHPSSQGKHTTPTNVICSYYIQAEKDWWSFADGTETGEYISEHFTNCQCTVETCLCSFKNAHLHSCPCIFRKMS